MYKHTHRWDSKFQRKTAFPKLTTGVMHIARKHNRFYTCSLCNSTNSAQVYILKPRSWRLLLIDPVVLNDELNRPYFLT